MDQKLISDLLEACGYPDKKSAVILENFDGKTGLSSHFWERLFQDPKFDKADLADMQFVVKLGELTGHHLPLVREILKMRKDQSIRSICDLLDLDWMSLISKKVDGRFIGAPTGVVGDTEDARITNYANALSARLAHFFPSAFIGQRLKIAPQRLMKSQLKSAVMQAERGAKKTKARRVQLAKKETNTSDGLQERLASYFDKHPYFDVQSSPIDEAEDPATYKDIKSLQLLFKSSPGWKPDAAVDLVEQGLGSAKQVTNMGKANFLYRHGMKLGDQAAKQTYQKATQRSALTLNLFAIHSPSVNSVSPAALDSASIGVTEIPQLKTLFGTLSFCECEEGRSVFSPAAYLVDALHFLEQYRLSNSPGAGQRTRGRSAAEERRALDVLLQRRADIGWLELSGKNTDTKLPYLDLVNEVLAAAVFPGKFEIDISDWEQEIYHKVKDDLDAGNIAEKIKEEFRRRHFSLPEMASVQTKSKGVSWYIRDGNWMFTISESSEGFDVWSATCHQTCSSANEISANPEYIDEYALAVISEELHPWNLSINFPTEAARIYLEHLGVLRFELMETFITDKTKQDILGTREKDRELYIASEYFGFTERERDILIGEALENGKPWQYWGLQKTNNAVHNPDNPEVFLQLAWEEALQRVPVFLQKSGLPFAALNDILASQYVNPGSKISVVFPETETLSATSRCDHERALLSGLNDGALQKIHCFLCLQRKSGWSILELDQVIRCFGWSMLNEQSIIDSWKLRRLQKELRVSLDEMLSWYNNIDTLSVTPDSNSFYDQLFLNASVLRPVNEAFCLNETRKDLAVNDDPDNNTHKLSDHIPTLLAALKISTSELDIVLAEAFDTANDAALNLVNLSRVHQSVSLARALGLPVWDLVSLKSMTGIDPFGDDKCNATWRLLDALHTVQSSQFSLIELDYLLRDAEWSQPGTSPDESVTSQLLTEIRDGLKKISDESGTANAPGYEVTKSKRKNYLKQKLGDVLNLEAKVVSSLITKWVSVPGIDNKMAIEIFLALEDTNGSVDVTFDKYRNQFITFELLYKISILIARFQIKSGQLGWLFKDSSSTKGNLWFGSTADRFDQWERLVYLFSLQAQIGESTLSAMLEKREYQPVPGVSEKDFNYLKDHGFIPQDHRDKEALKRFPMCLSALKQLGVTADKAINWCKPELRSNDARTLKQIIKARYDDEQWLGIARPLEDTLREKRRDLLVSYHLSKLDMENTHELYQHFLLDVGMSPCMMTSRIKLAISALQLFIQRCLMNLEQWRIPTSALAMEWRTRWQWMKNYRVWEANRKVFLYPENWIVPELRPDKSVFFKDLENELLQGEMTNETAEQAFANYLEKLSQVARLDICGLYHERESESAGGGGPSTLDVLHVFGKTRGTPARYFYRRQVNGTWTSWEPINVDIEGDHLIPVVFNRRLHLFWPLFVQRSEPLKDINKNDLIINKNNQNIQQTWDYWEIQLTFSEYREGTWSSKTVSEQKLSINQPPESIDTKNKPEPLKLHEKRTRELKVDFTFKTLLENDALNIYAVLRESNYEYKGHFQCSADGQISALPEPGKPYAGNRFPVSVPIEGGYYHNMLVKIRDSSDLRFLRAEPILAELPSASSLVFSHQIPQDNWMDCFFYQDEEQVFFVKDYQGSESSYDYAMRKSQATETSVVELTSDNNESLEATSPEPSYPWEPMANSTGESANREGLTMTSRIPLSELAPEHLYRFENAYHPLVRDFMKRLNRDGIDSLLRRGTQYLQRESLLFRISDKLMPWFAEGNKSKVKQVFKNQGIEFSGVPQIEPINGAWKISADIKEGPKGWQCYVAREQGSLHVYRDFKQRYRPAEKSVDTAFPLGEVEFNAPGAYSQYNWELFFHAPLLIADRLSKNQRFEEAQKWYHYVFDPTDTSCYSAPQKYWNLRPFFETARGKPIQDLLILLGYEGDDKAYLRAKQDIETQLTQWQKDPFEPHVIARLRPGAYQKSVVMNYIDNLIVWGDQLFRLDSIESINEATQLYILAAEMLGNHPVSVPSPVDVPARNFEEIQEQLDDFSNPLIQLDDKLPEISEVGRMAAMPGDMIPAPSLELAYIGSADTNQGQQPYFGIPRNAKLLGYWDTVADRLFKVRHCMNIAGVVRQLPLFESPIEPGLLVSAKAAGVDIQSALTDIDVSLPHYRFAAMLQNALELCKEVKAHGGALLSALKDKDAESLSRLKMGQVGADLSGIKARQVEEIRHAIDVLKNAKQIAEARKKYNQKKPALNTLEIAQVSFLAAQKLSVYGAAVAQYFASSAAVFPDFYQGAAGISSPLFFAVTVGGGKTKSAADSWAKGLEYTAKVFEDLEKGAGLMAKQQRIAEECAHQVNVISMEIEQIEKKILGSQIRLDIAQKELENYQLEVKNANEVNAHMRDRFNNLELYNWMVSQLSTLYFQSYQMAYDLSKRAEQAFFHELDPEQHTSYIRFGYWDSMKKGLLAGERLYYDLQRMQAAYLEQHKRDYEITKHISLAMVYPEALIDLKKNGKCEVELSETLFDLDYPGHYLRRIKSVSLTVDCKQDLQPYTNINCTLTLLANRVRIKGTLDAGYKRASEDPRFRDELGAIQSIVTSSGRDDSGLFQLNFHDDRYLPFEGAGAISNWQFELYQANNQIDIQSISDVILHIRYTARGGGKELEEKAREYVTDSLSEYPLWRPISVKHEYTQAWTDFVANTKKSPDLGMSLTQSLFPAMFRDREIKIDKAWLFLKPKKEAGVDDAYALPFKLSLAEQTSRDGEFSIKDSPMTGAPYARLENLNASLGAWRISIDAKNAERLKELEDMFMLLSYSAKNNR